MDSSIYLEAFTELKKLGAKTKWTSDGEAIRISRSLGGLWFLTEQNGYHAEAQRKYLCLTPKVKNVLNNFEKHNPEFSANGGRVFLTKECLFRKS